MKDYDKNNESLYLIYWDVNNLCGWAMSQKLLVNYFKWLKIFLNLMKALEKVKMKKVVKEISLKLIFNT